MAIRQDNTALQDSNQIGNRLAGRSGSDRVLRLTSSKTEPRRAPARAAFLFSEQI